jgi:hypothetical protein
MENTAHSEEGAPLIWKVAFYTLVFTALTSMSWHLGEMRVVHERERSEISALRGDIAPLEEYRDILAESGTTSAMNYLEKQKPNKYEF